MRWCTKIDKYKVCTHKRTPTHTDFARLVSANVGHDRVENWLLTEPNIKGQFNNDLMAVVMEEMTMALRVKKKLKNDSLVFLLTFGPKSWNGQGQE